MGKLCQRSVTLQVAQFVVDGFEMIQIQHEQGKRRAIGACLFVHLGGRFQKALRLAMPVSMSVVASRCSSRSRFLRWVTSR